MTSAVIVNYRRVFRKVAGRNVSWQDSVGGELRRSIHQAQHINVGLVVNLRSGFLKNQTAPKKDHVDSSGTRSSSIGFCEI